MSPTTVQIFIVVVMPGTHVHTTVAKIYRRSHAGNACYYDCTDIYRRSHAGNACYYDCADIYRRSLTGYVSILRLYNYLSS